MNKPWWQQLSLSLALIVIIVFLVAANVVYQVSSVELAYLRRVDAWKESIESQYGYTGCLVMDDSVRTIRILTLRCRSTSLKYIHIAEGGTLLGESEANAFSLSERRQWAIDQFGLDVTTSVTYYAGKTVLRIVSPDQEILVDPNSLEELWKVTWNDE